MTISTNNARQGEVSENHSVAKIVAISTIASFLILTLIAFGF